VVVAFRGSGRDLECVGCGDLIVDAVLDVIDASVVANAYILRGPFVQGKWRVLLSEMIGEKVILRAISSWSLFLALWLMLSEALKMNGSNPFWLIYAGWG
jgi:hypothetical protein